MGWAAAGLRGERVEGLVLGRLVARAMASGCTGSAGIARRSSAYGRGSSVEDAHVGLGAQKSPNGVREVRKVDRRKKRAKRGPGVAGVHRKWRLTAAAEAELVGGVRAAWWLSS